MAKATPGPEPAQITSTISSKCPSEPNCPPESVIGKAKIGQTEDAAVRHPLGLDGFRSAGRPVHHRHDADHGSAGVAH